MFTILSPKQAVKQFALKPRWNNKLGKAFQLNFEQDLLTRQRIDLVEQTIAYYQSASARLKANHTTNKVL
jgi:hypothetical protein